MFLHEYELIKAGSILVKELFKLKPDETFVITADTESDSRVVDATASAAFTIGAKPLVIWLASPLGEGKAADPMLPVKALTAVLKEADAWVEFNKYFLQNSTPYNIAMKENKKLRFLGLDGMNAAMMKRCIGRVNYPVLRNFLEKITEITRDAKYVRMTTALGTDVEFENAKTQDGKPNPNHPFSTNAGYADTPGVHFLAGQIGWVPDFKSINGTIVFDGSLVEMCGILKDPVSLTIEEGEIIKIEGGRQAMEFEDWTKSFNHPQMFKLAHATYGFHPGAMLTGIGVEDERIWGCTVWGMGAVDATFLNPGGISAPSHSDGICLNTSVWLDGKQIMEKGKMVKPDLAKLAKELGKS